MKKIEPDNMDVESFCNAIGCTTQEFNKRVKETKRFLKTLRCKFTEQELISSTKKSFFMDKMAQVTIEEIREVTDSESLQEVMKAFE